MASDIRIYVASLTDYNGGILHGEWIDVTDTDTMHEQITAMLAKSPSAKQEGSVAEEFAIHDHEGFGDIHVSEYADLEELAQLAESIEEHGEAFLAWAANATDNRDKDDFEEAYRGEFSSLADYVEDWWEQTGGKPEAPKGSWWHPANYIDWDGMARDLELNGEVFSVNSPKGVYVFENR